MVKAYPAPKVRYPGSIWVAYLYAIILIGGAVAALMGLGGFDLAFITYETPGLPVMTVILAGMAIFALPFLLRLPLSPLARFLSALLALFTPVMIAGYVVYLVSEVGLAADVFLLPLGILLIALGVASFIILSGTQALRFSKK